MEHPQYLTDWTTIRELGSGSFAKVYEIKNVNNPDSAKYHSALKVITIPPSHEAYSSYIASGYTHEEIGSIIKDQVSRIEQECQIMADLKGLTNIVSYEEHVVRRMNDGVSWQILIRMELLLPLIQYLDTQFMTDQLVITLGKDICTALSRCLRRKIIHRDIKPQNIFINRDGDFKLGDFGIARTMESSNLGTMVGTYSYMAPEVFLNRPYDHRVDVYSLGMVLYWILNERRLPFLPLPPAVPTGADRDNAFTARMRGDAFPSPKNGSSALKQAVMKACAFRPEDRYESAIAFRKALQEAEQGIFTEQQPVAPPPETTSHDPSDTIPPVSPPAHEPTEGNRCPWCRGRGGAIFVHSLKRHKYIAFRDTCTLCAGIGELSAALVPHAREQYKSIMHSQEKWTAENSCKCCHGRGRVYSDQPFLPKNQKNAPMFGITVPCPMCAGHKVRMLLTGKQQKAFNHELRRKLVFRGIFAGMLLGVLPPILDMYQTLIFDGSPETIPALFILLFFVLLRPYRFYAARKNIRIANRAALRNALLLSYFLLFIAVSVMTIFLLSLTR